MGWQTQNPDMNPVRRLERLGGNQADINAEILKAIQWVAYGFSEDAPAGNLTVNTGETLLRGTITIAEEDTYTVNGTLITFGVLTVKGILIVSGTVIVY